MRRYLVHGEPPREKAKLVKGVRAHVHIPINPDTEEVRAHGWASIADPYDLDLTSDKLFVGGALCVSLRIDTLRPPAAVVKRLTAERLRALDHPPSRGEKKAAKAEVVRVLRKQYFPTTRTVDLAWELDEGRVFFWSHAKGTNELVCDLFAKSFNLELVAAGPGIVLGPGRIPAGLEPTPELVFGFPGLPGRAVTEDADA